MAAGGAKAIYGRTISLRMIEERRNVFMSSNEYETVMVKLHRRKQERKTRKTRRKEKKKKKEFTEFEMLAK